MMEMEEEIKELIGLSDKKGISLRDHEGQRKRKLFIGLLEGNRAFLSSLFHFFSLK